MNAAIDGLTDWFIICSWRTGLLSVIGGLVYNLLLTDWFIICCWRFGLLLLTDWFIICCWRTGLSSAIDGLVYKLFDGLGYLLLTAWFIIYKWRIGLFSFMEGLVYYVLLTYWFINYLTAWFIIYYWRTGLFSFIDGLFYYITLTAWFVLCYWRLGLLYIIDGLVCYILTDWFITFYWRTGAVYHYRIDSLAFLLLGGKFKLQGWLSFPATTDVTCFSQSQAGVHVQCKWSDKVSKTKRLPAMILSGIFKALSVAVHTELRSPLLFWDYVVVPRPACGMKLWVHCFCQVLNSPKAFARS